MSLNDEYIKARERFQIQRVEFSRVFFNRNASWFIVPVLCTTEVDTSSRNAAQTEKAHDIFYFTSVFV